MLQNVRVHQIVVDVTLHLDTVFVVFEVHVVLEREGDHEPARILVGGASHIEHLLVKRDPRVRVFDGVKDHL